MMNHEWREVARELFEDANIPYKARTLIEVLLERVEYLDEQLVDARKKPTFDRAAQEAKRDAQREQWRRDQFASMAMRSLIERDPHWDDAGAHRHIALVAREFADAMIAELDGK